MCEVCGCDGAGGKRVAIEVQRPLLEDNDREARHLREHFSAASVLAINLMGSPGAGKTALLEATARALSNRRRLAAVSGDLATDLDAQRLRRAGVVSQAITTGRACHLEASMVHRALHDAALGEAVRSADYFFVENVGNLICPAIYDVGQHVSVVAIAVTEGVDKPLKYPTMFERVDLAVVTKLDLMPHLPGFSLAELLENVSTVRPGLPVLAVSAVSGEGIELWTGWLEGRARLLDGRAQGLEHRLPALEHRHEPH